MYSHYRTREGESLDWVCWRHYGQQSGAVEAVLAVNPGLAEHGPKLPGGLLILLPDLPKRQKTVVRLWD